MAKRFTLFTGQWADLTLDEVAGLAAGWGYDGLEIAVSGEHLDAWRVDEPGYVEERLALLERHGLKVWAISNHLTGQTVCDDPIDERHRAIVRERVWGDGSPEGVRERAAEEMKLTARLAQKMGVDTVIGSTGSAIWPYVAMFPPVPAARIDAGYQDFADRWHPILDVFDECGVLSLIHISEPTRLVAISDGCTSWANRTPHSSKTSRIGFHRSAKSW